jgi:hypothetical protein
MDLPWTVEADPHNNWLFRNHTILQ